MKVYEKQNDEKYLKLLFASRKIYNVTDCFNSLSLLFSIAVAIIGLYDIADNTFLSIIVAIMLVITFILQIMIPYMLKYAFNMRNYIDYELLQIGDQIQDYRKITEAAYKVCNIFKNKCALQMINDGNSKIRGVKNWYSVIKSTNKNEVIFHCQKENCWFDKKICNIYLIIIAFITMIFISIYLYINKDYTILEMLKKLLPLVPIFLLLIERIISYIKYFKISINIKYQINNIESDKNISLKDLCKLQRLIQDRRSLNFIPPNFIHKVLSSYFHKRKSEIDSLQN